jgi:hypothetical protein
VIRRVIIEDEGEAFYQHCAESDRREQERQLRQEHREHTFRKLPSFLVTVALFAFGIGAGAS